MQQEAQRWLLIREVLVSLQELHSRETAIRFNIWIALLQSEVSICWLV